MGGWNPRVWGEATQSEATLGASHSRMSQPEGGKGIGEKRQTAASSCARDRG